jgi:hypothetical protein
VASALTAAGYSVFPCSGQLPASVPEKFKSPNLVLLHAEVAEALQPLAETFWPGVPCEIVQDFQEDAKLIAQVDSALRNPPPKVTFRASASRPRKPVS